MEAVAVSPDGSCLAFDWNVSGNSDIWKMPAAGGNPQQLTATPEDEFAPSWSPDGSEIAVHSFRHGNRDIALIPSGGGEPRLITSTPAPEWAPVFSPDGKALLYDLEKDGGLQSYMLRRSTDGRWSEPARLTRRLTFGPDPVPGGRFISVRDSVGWHLLPADGLGGDPALAVRRDSLIDVAAPAWAADGKGLFREIRHPTLGTGIWYQPLGEGPGRMVVRVDDPAMQLGQQMAASATGLFFILTRRDSDLWSVEVRRR